MVGNWIERWAFRIGEAEVDYIVDLMQQAACRPWMRYLGLWGPPLAYLWDWARPSFPLLPFSSCLWVLSSTATLLSGNGFFFSFFFWFSCSFAFTLLGTFFYCFFSWIFHRIKEIAMIFISMIRICSPGSSATLLTLM